MKIRYMPFYAENVEQQARFFIDKLGFKPAGKQGAYKNQTCVLVNSGQDDVLIAISDDKAYRDFKCWVIMNTDDCLKTFHQLKDAGLALFREPHYRDVGLVAELCDERGNRFMLLEERNYNDDI